MDYVIATLWPLSDTIAAGSARLPPASARRHDRRWRRPDPSRRDPHAAYRASRPPRRVSRPRSQRAVTSPTCASTRTGVHPATAPTPADSRCVMRARRAA